MNARKLHVLLVLTLSSLALVATWLLIDVWSSGLPVAQARGSDAYSVYYVAPGANCGTGYTPCFGNLQAAVDAADHVSDVIKVAAGVYTGTGDSVVREWYVPVTIRGGYTTTNNLADPPYPLTQPTTLDGEGERGVVALGGSGGPYSLTLEGLRLTNGTDYSGGALWAKYPPHHQRLPDL